MIVSVNFSTKQLLESLFEFIKARAADPAHAANANTIADFVDSFMVVEIKRLSLKDEDHEEEIEFPDELIYQPLIDAKAKMDKIFEESLKKINITPAPTTDPGLAASTPTTQAPAAPPVAPPAPTSKPRNGNGHKSQKVRSMLDGEKDFIRSEFLRVNGQIADDACVEMKKSSAIAAEVAIFQVTGFVSYLHRKVAEGDLTVNDLPAYLTFLQGHRGLWMTYNSPKYEEMRRRAALRSAPTQVTASVATPSMFNGPKFASIPRR